jgi:hypothetical protein
MRTGKSSLRVVGPYERPAKLLRVEDTYASCTPAGDAAMRQWFNTKQAADYLGCTAYALQHYVNQKLIVPDRRGRTGRGGSHLFARERLDAFARGSS